MRNCSTSGFNVSIASIASIVSMASIAFLSFFLKKNYVFLPVILFIFCNFDGEIQFYHK